MNIDVTEQDGQVLATVIGEIDSANCTELNRALPAEGSSLPLALDLAGLSFIDSSGVSELLRLRDATIGAGRSFAIEAASPAVMRVLDITGLLEIFGLEK